MRTFLSVIGIILIIVGIVTLGYRGYTYTTQEKIAQLGPLQVTQQQEKTVYFPPLLGGASIIAGIFLVIVARVTKK